MPMDFSCKVVQTDTDVILPEDTNQVQELAIFAQKFITTTEPAKVLCGLSALSHQTSAPTISPPLHSIRHQANGIGARVFGSPEVIAPEKAVASNCSAVREWDGNGTLFGYREGKSRHQAGEFGHNDFYPVVIAAAHVMLTSGREFDGVPIAASIRIVVRAMICLDEIRSRLAEVFSLKSYRIDHVLYGAIASAILQTGATVEQIDSAVGMVVCHYTPWRAIRAGHQLSDSKGASAALSAETAVMSVHRAVLGFKGPRDIFRNPQSLFCWFEPPAKQNSSPFPLILTHAGPEFAVMAMHFKLGLYEHQSASAIHGLLKLMTTNPEIYRNPLAISRMTVRSYSTAVGIIGDPDKRTPTTRQSADHSMMYILAALIEKAHVNMAYLDSLISSDNALSQVWETLMLMPADYSVHKINTNQTIKNIISKIVVESGGAVFDKGYPKGIPTQVVIEYSQKRSKDATSEVLTHKEPDLPDVVADTGLVMFPIGHCRNEDREEMTKLLNIKFCKLGALAFDKTEDLDRVLFLLRNLKSLKKRELFEVYNFEFVLRQPVDE